MGSCADTDINPKYNIQDVIREKRSSMKKTLEEKHIRELRCTTFPFSVRPRLSTSYQYIQMHILTFLFFAKHRGNVDNSGQLSITEISLYYFGVCFGEVRLCSKISRHL